MQRDGGRGGIPPADRTTTNQGGIIPNIDYFSFVPYVFKMRVVKRTIITIPQELFPTTNNLTQYRQYRLLNNTILTPLLRDVVEWTTPNEATLGEKVNVQICKDFPYMRFGKLRMRLSNFIPVINSVNAAGNGTINMINPAPWMCIAMDTKSSHRKIQTRTSNQWQDQWLDLHSQNSILISGINRCSQWSHVESLQMGQTWTYEQSYENDKERWWGNIITNDIANIDNTTAYMLPSNTQAPGINATSWWNPVYPRGNANTYHSATSLPPIAVYIPHIGGLDKADNSPEISGSATLEISLTLYFSTHVEPYNLATTIQTWDMNNINLKTIKSKKLGE